MTFDVPKATVSWGVKSCSGINTSLSDGPPASIFKALQ
jgi:hypothetical protein